LQGFRFRDQPINSPARISFIKTLNGEAVYPMVFEAFEDVAEHLPRFIEEICHNRRLYSALGYLGSQLFEDEHIPQFGKSAA
jgi:putative transposase